MEALVNYWSVTFYASNREGERAVLREFSVWLRRNNTKFGSVGVIDLPPESPPKVREEAKNMVPFVWIPHINGEEAQALVRQSGIVFPDVTYEQVEIEVEPEIQDESGMASADQPRAVPMVPFKIPI